MLELQQQQQHVLLQGARQQQLASATGAAGSSAGLQVFKRRLYSRPNLLTHRKAGAGLQPQISLDSATTRPSAAAAELPATGAAPVSPAAPLLSGQLPAIVAAAADLPSASMQPALALPMPIPVPLPRASGDAGSGNSASTLALLPAAAVAPHQAATSLLLAPLVRACQARVALQSMLADDAAFAADHGCAFLPPTVAASVAEAVKQLDSHLLRVMGSGAIPGLPTGLF